ncbi:MAG TPA: hypothetical protein VFF27_00525 [Bacteroidia bacterium]|jgi:hypothetical protein|nr:hypothetical protein [Bacteroidia bacterium]
MTDIVTSRNFVLGFSKSNSSTTETELCNYVLEPALMTGEGDYLEITAKGDFAKNNNNKQVKLKFGSTLIFDSGLIASNGGKWEISVTITCTGESSETAAAAFLINAVQQTSLDTSPSETIASEIPLVLFGKGTFSRDVTGKSLEIKYFKNPTPAATA